MAAQIIPSSAACVSSAGSGVATTWTIAGSTAAYTGTVTGTDGYNVSAAVVWQDTAQVSLASETINVGNSLGMGSCIETLGADNLTALATGVTTDGNYALCHFFYWIAAASGTVTWTRSIGGGQYDWGESRYLNETQWGVAGAGIVGNTMNASGGGTTMTATANGATITPAGASGTTTIPAGSKTFYWLQPTWATQYTSSALRRYNGGGTEVESVKGYCISQRLLTGASNQSGGIVANSVVALTGAGALAASAIALGVASLAI